MIYGCVLCFRTLHQADQMRPSQLAFSVQVQVQYSTDPDSVGYAQRAVHVGHDLGHAARSGYFDPQYPKVLYRIDRFYPLSLTTGIHLFPAVRFQSARRTDTMRN